MFNVSVKLDSAIRPGNNINMLFSIPIVWYKENEPERVIPFFLFLNQDDKDLSDIPFELKD
jgi:hypothetical protein